MACVYLLCVCRVSSVVCAAVRHRRGRRRDADFPACESLLKTCCHLCDVLLKHATARTQDMANRKQAESAREKVLSNGPWWECGEEGEMRPVTSELALSNTLSPPELLLSTGRTMTAFCRV
ncbi:uncharacterized protein V1518DRAFT_419306 [Limtongia smithiae]|uniref:uncharacterized protein n=1 Tax=Limtongia smithiae TaxID=1125753 RepID=UPI0034CDBE46